MRLAGLCNKPSINQSINNVGFTEVVPSFKKKKKAKKKKTFSDFDEKHLGEGGVGWGLQPVASRA